VLILDFRRDNLLVAALDQVQRWLQPSHFGIASVKEMRRRFSILTQRNPKLETSPTPESIEATSGPVV
jgi:hypothetical protein